MAGCCACPTAFAVGLLLLNIAIVGWVEPYSRYRYEGLRFDLRSGALGAAIKVGEFNTMGKRMTLRIERSEEEGTRLSGIFTALEDKSGMRVAASAESGQFLATDDPDTIIFRLKKGRLVQDSPKFTTPRTLAFDSYDLPINLPSIDPFRGRGSDRDELNLDRDHLARLRRRVDQGQRERQSRRARQSPLPAGRSGDDADAAVARDRARGAAQAIVVGRSASSSRS